MRVVLDSNILVSAFTQPQGQVVTLWVAALDRRYHLLTSPAIVSEVGQVLRTKFQVRDQVVIRQLKVLTQTAQIISPRHTLHVIPEDPDDDRILECAVEGKADVVVSGGRHLRRLKAYKGIPILRPVDFLRTLGET